MKEEITRRIAKILKKEEDEIGKLIEIPPNPDLGDYSIPCFSFSKELKKSPQEIANSLSKKIGKMKGMREIKAVGPYLNFFIDEKEFAKSVILDIERKKDKYGSNSEGKGKTAVIDMSSPNIAKPFGIGHLRSTIIGNSVSEIGKFNGYKVIKINYLGDWGTQFGKLIVGFKKFGSESKLKKEKIKHLLDIYVKVSNDENLEDGAREAFKKLESGDKETLKIWKKFKELSLKEFEEIYKVLGTEFDVVSGESFYNDKMSSVVSDLEKKKLLKKSDGAEIVDLEKYGLGVVLIKKSDGTSLYATRDLAAAIYRHKKYRASHLLYEVGSEQNLHFNQIKKILSLLGHKWAENLIHINHGLYLDKDGKKFATRKGKTIFMSDILEKTINLARKGIQKREKVSKSELGKRAKAIALSAIFYGDLKNYRSNDIVFDVNKFLDFEGNTGPYLLYTYARAKSIIRKSKSKGKMKVGDVSDKEKELILLLSQFPEIVKDAYRKFSPNLIANYAYSLAQKFNGFYHSSHVLGAEDEAFKISLVSASAQTLKNSLSLLGIDVLERM